MSTTKPQPRHGTRARYRLEIKPGPDGAKGIPCDRCKAANSKAAAEARARRTAHRRRADIHLVEPLPADTPADTAADTLSPDDAPPVPGPMEQAVLDDIAEIPADLHVAMHRSLSVLATQLARDFDAAETHTARSAASRQIADVIRSLRTKREGDGSSSLDWILEEFGSGPPGIPQRRA